MRASEADDEQFYRDTERIAFPALSDEQLATLDSLGARRKVSRGEMPLKDAISSMPRLARMSGGCPCAKSVRWVSSQESVN